MLKIYKKILAYVPKERYLAYVAIGLTVVSTTMTVTAYYYLSVFLKELIMNEKINQAISYSYIVVGLLLVSFLIYMGALMLTHLLGFRLETNLRKYGIDGLTKSSFRFFDMHSSGKTRRIIDDNATQTHMIVAHMIPDNASVILTPIMVLILGFMIDWKVGVALVLLVVFGFAQITFMTQGREFLNKYQTALEKMSNETVEYVRGMPVVKIFGASTASFKALYNSITDYSNYALNYALKTKRVYPLFQLAFICLTTILIPIVVLGMDTHAEPKTLIVHLIMTLFLAGVLFTSFIKVMYVSMNAYLGVTTVEKLETLFDQMKEDALTFGTEEQFANFNIEFDHVDFAYGNEMVLKDFNLKLDGNKVYALVGASGSGKSTVAKLISGFYKINSGAIKIGGQNISNYSEEAIMKNIAFVFQNPKLFKKSIYENVKIGNLQASDEEIKQALHLAGCDGIINKFAQKEHTIIGSKGVYLSGGEKQRIAIARAILKNANIIILDEASASVDPENEHELQKAFAHLMKDKTVIMIAHRLSSIRHVDEILVMDNGQIVERGTHEKLMQQNGQYTYFQKLYNEANEWSVRDGKTI